MKEVDEFAHAQELLQRDAFLGRKGAAMVLLRQLPNALGGVLVEFEFKNRAGSVGRLIPLAREKRRTPRFQQRHATLFRGLGQQPNSRAHVRCRNGNA